MSQEVLQSMHQIRKHSIIFLEQAKNLTRSTSSNALKQITQCIIPRTGKKRYKKYFSQCLKSDNTVLYSSNRQRTSQEVLQSMPQIRKHSVMFLKQAKKRHQKYFSLDCFLTVQGILHCVIRFESLTEVLLVMYFCLFEEYYTVLI